MFCDYDLYEKVNTPDVDSAQIFIVNRKAALSFDDGAADSASSCLWSGNDILMTIQLSVCANRRHFRNLSAFSTFETFSVQIRFHVYKV